MANIHYSFCNLCDSCCGIIIEHDNEKILSVKGDKEHPLSKCQVCPKCLALMDIHNDPDRLRTPVKKTDNGWKKISWNEAIHETGRRIADIQRRYGNDSLAFYFGNPVAHNYSTLLTILPFISGLRTKNIYTANSVDAWPRLLVSILLYGNQALLPVPDIDRTGYFLILGANPAITHGSIMTAPDCIKRLKDIQRRGGKIVVIDPRRSETARIADEHYFIIPGTDHLLLLAIINIIFKEKLIKLNHLQNKIDGLNELKQIVSEFSPENVSRSVGMRGETIYKIAREFTTARNAVCYGRMGVCVQETGTISTWLIDVLNIITGNLDSPGGAMFTTPAVDLVSLAKFLRKTGWFGRVKSRVNKFPDLTGELPVAAIYDELETPGNGQIKALITLSGNPVLSIPNSRRFERALKNLEFMVSIDFYINETTRFADIILPPVTYFECDHYPIIELATAVRNIAQYSPALFTGSMNSRGEWEILMEIEKEIASHRGLIHHITGNLKYNFIRKVGPRRMLNLLLKFGPHKLSLKKLQNFPHGIDLGPLKPRLEEELNSTNKRINLVPELIKHEIENIKKKLSEAQKSVNTFKLINRRHLLSMNTYLHNFPRLLKGNNRCTLLMNPEDAKKLNIADGELVQVRSRTGAIEIPVEITDEIMQGVVCIPFGWGHGRDGVKLGIAFRNPGVNINDITDEKIYDSISKTSAVNGMSVTIEKVICS